MAKVLTPVDEFSDEVIVPEGGDARTAASVEIPFQVLTNNSVNHEGRLADAEDAIDAQEAITAPLVSGGTINPGAILNFGLNVMSALFFTPLTTGTPATIGSGAFRRVYTHLNLGAEFADTLDEDSAVLGDWVIIRQAGSGGISVKTETGPTEIAVLGPAGTQNEVGLFYFNGTTWALGWLMSTSWAS